MTARDMAQLLDARVSYRVPGTDLLVHGAIADVRTRFGAVDVLFTPEAGSGTKWMSRDSVTLLDDGDACTDDPAGRTVEWYRQA